MLITILHGARFVIKAGKLTISKTLLKNRLLLLCDECDDTLWDSPADLKSDNPIIVKIELKLTQPTLEEIKKLGWDKFLSL